MSPRLIKWIDFLLIITLFMFAGYLRLVFQANSVVDHPIRADAAVYVSVAYNLHTYGVYSSQRAKGGGQPPETDFQRPPVYPFFLCLIMAVSEDINDFITNTTMCQALLSTMAVLLVFAICRQFLSSGYAFGAGLLTSLSPHLIAIDKYLLSESIFELFIVIAVFMLVLAVKQNNKYLFGATGMLFGWLVLIRPVALLLGPFMALSLTVFLWRRWLPRQLLIMILLIVMGYAMVYAPFLVIRNQLSNNFSVSGQTVWDKVVIGSDIGLKHFISNKTVPERKTEAAKMYTDKAYAAKKMLERFRQDPVGYLKWYLGGKLLFLWKWDNVYAGDVYQYHMARKGFDVHPVLKVVHKLMRFLHWPLFFLTLFAIILIIWERLKGSGNFIGSHAPAVLVLIFVYFAVIFTVLVPLPRYGIPLRPFSYILAVISVKALLAHLFLREP